MGTGLSFGLAGRRAIVTGHRGGIGGAIARVLADDGAEEINKRGKIPRHQQPCRHPPIIWKKRKQQKPGGGRRKKFDVAIKNPHRLGTPPLRRWRIGWRA